MYIHTTSKERIVTTASFNDDDFGAFLLYAHHLDATTLPVFRQAVKFCQI